jgi:SAM-dependent methyltransferase
VTVNLLDHIQRYWDQDAATYDRSSGHDPRTPVERAAWLGALEQLLPRPPASVLDVGAGTGFLSLQAATLGHKVTAVDVAPAMLDRLRAKASDAGLSVDTRQGDAAAPPDGPFDAVVERHLLWTLADPVAALAAWRRVAPHGRLVLFESAWGAGARPVDQLRSRALQRLRKVRGVPPDHHAAYTPDVQAALPLGDGPSPAALIEVVAAAGWPAPRLVRLRDVEWALAQAQPPLERLLGVAARFAVVAG